ncbi:hypothetical protein DFQ26_007701 [Actinomortierella ambigua]|nr:hypothetical protein DFQ26_007701 [Actinomortierella ambigua]
MMSNRATLGSTTPFTTMHMDSVSSMATLTSNQGTKVRNFYERPWEMHRPSDHLLPLSIRTSTANPRFGLNLFDYETGQLRAGLGSTAFTMTMTPSTSFMPRGASTLYPRQVSNAATAPIGLGLDGALEHPVTPTPEIRLVDPQTSTSPPQPRMAMATRRQTRKSSPTHWAATRTATHTSHHPPTTTPSSSSSTSSSSASWATVNGSGGEHYSVIGIKHGDWPKDRIEDGRWWGGGLHTSLVQESMLLLPLSTSLSFQHQHQHQDKGQDRHTPTLSSRAAEGVDISHYDHGHGHQGNTVVAPLDSTRATATTNIATHTNTTNTATTNTLGASSYSSTWLMEPTSTDAAAAALRLSSSYGSDSSTSASHRMCISSDDESMASLSRHSRSSSIEGYPQEGPVSHEFVIHSGNDGGARKASPPTNSEMPPNPRQLSLEMQQQQQQQQQQKPSRPHLPLNTDMMDELRQGLAAVENDLDDFGDGSIRARAAAIMQRERQQQQQHSSGDPSLNQLSFEGDDIFDSTDIGEEEEDDDGDGEDDDDEEEEEADEALKNNFDLELNGLPKTHLHKMYVATSSPRRHPSHHLRYLCVHHDRNTMLASHHDPAAISPTPLTAESRFEGLSPQFHSYSQQQQQESSPLDQQNAKHEQQASLCSLPKMTLVGNRHLSVEYAAEVVETKKCPYCFARPCKANVEIQVQFGLVRVSLDWILSGFPQS